MGEPETREAYDLFQWLFQQHAFMFCLERPVRYCPGGKSPYPKEKHPQVFTNSTKSRLILNSEKLLSDESFAALSKCHQNYETALGELHGQTGVPNTGSTFLDEVERAIKDYNHWKTKVVQKRTQKKYKFLESFSLPIIPASTLVEPVKPDYKQEFHKACARYKKLLNCEEIDENEEGEDEEINETNVMEEGRHNRSSSSFNVRRGGNLSGVLKRSLQQKQRLPKKPSIQNSPEEQARLNRIKLKREFPINMPERINTPKPRKPRVGKKRKQERKTDLPRKKRKKDAMSDEEYFELPNENKNEDESEAELMKLLNEQF